MPNQVKDAITRARDALKLADEAIKGLIEEGLPKEFVRINETPEKRAKREASAKKHTERIKEQQTNSVTVPQMEQLLVDVAEKKKTKARGRIAKMKAKASGETKKMPTSGKEAALVIKAAAKKNTEAAKSTQEPAGAKRTPPAPAKAKLAQRTGKAANGNGTHPPSKMQLIAKVLTRKEGCTVQDLLDVTHWRGISMSATAKKLHLTLRQERVGDAPIRYWGIPTVH